MAAKLEQTTTSSKKGWICLSVFGFELGNTTVSPQLYLSYCSVWGFLISAN